MTSREPARAGEVALGFDPGALPGDARLVFIGRVRSPWRESRDCPKNMAAAREAPRAATVEIDLPYRAGLTGLSAASHVILLTWLDRAARNLIVQAPRNAKTPRGTFALRSPVRPNPVGVHVATLAAIDISAGILDLTAIDVLDGTPVIDVKPYYPSTDSVPDAVPPRS